MSDSKSTTSFTDRLRRWLGFALRGQWPRLRRDIDEWLHPERHKKSTISDGEVLSDGPAIANMLVTATEEKVSVEVGFGNKIHVSEK